MKKHRGFTLIELLIVLLVLGVLSGVTIFSTLGVATTADAQKIINDMIMLRTAALMWYKENTSRLEYKDKNYQIKTNGKLQQFSEFIRDHGSEILKYIDNRSSITLNYKTKLGNTGEYALIAVGQARKWYVCCNLGSPDSMLSDSSKWKGEEAPEAKVREKIAGRTKKSKSSGTDSIELFGIDNLDPQSVETPYSGQKFVCMQILELAAR